MLHPSYSEIMNVVNSEVEQGDTPVVNSRYSIVLATAKRARQIIAHQSREGQEVNTVSKPLSKAVAELYDGKIKILPEEAEEVVEETAAVEEAVEVEEVETAETTEE